MLAPGSSSLCDVPAPAKLNLFLHVIGRRPDGYHEIQSVFVALDWFDTLHFERRADGAIRRHDLGAELPPEDLIVSAARLLQEQAQVPWGADISVEKRIPSQAGLGGGSSDAATTLIALNRLWGLDWPRPRLAILAARLGADVPFFLHRGPAWVQGIGEELHDVSLPASVHETIVAVLKPAAGLSTAQIFCAPTLTRNTKPARIADFLTDESRGLSLSGDETPMKEAPALFGFGHNDLETVVMAGVQDVRDAHAWLAHWAGPARMTGSGSAVFAPVVKNMDNLLRQAKSLPQGWQFRLCRILGTHPLADW